MPLQATALYSGGDFSNSGIYIYMNGIFIWTDFGADYGDTGGSQALKYHHLFFNENHSWGSYFGIGGCYDTADSIRLSASAYGLYLNHPTLVQNAYDKLGSRTDSYHRVDLPYESLSFHTGGGVDRAYPRSQVGLFLWCDDDKPAGNPLHSSPHTIQVQHIVIRTEHHPFQGSSTSDVLAIGYGIQNDPAFTRHDHGIFAQELDCSSVNNNVGRYFGSFVMPTIIC